MKKVVYIIALALAFSSCKTGSTSSVAKKNTVDVNINLTTIKDDKVLVTVTAPEIKTDEVIYSIPKTVPGTYSTDNYGKYSDNFKAFDSKGNALVVKRIDDNSWSISDAKKLQKVTYWVGDTFDTEKGTGFGNDDIFSPAGTNINAGVNFLINTHGFVGYFKDKLNIPYNVTITHPETLWGATTMTDEDASKTTDKFVTSRYAVLVENPIMYAKPDYTTFNVNGMDILIAVYSPSGKFTAESITPEMKTMMTAQKNFLGKVNATKKYTVLLYLSSLAKDDAHGFGALEHPTATTVVLPESLPKEKLVESMKDVVSHEFFHIVTPLTVHSKEIQYFDYNDPKMSEHLWMYEGVTEYFANLFQINQNLINEAEFYTRIADKIEQSKQLNDTMSFTKMSANILKQPYKDQYLNVYQKGALIGMCIDIIIREKSNGERGILDLMHKLSDEYGVEKPFNDDELFAEITRLTYPEVGAFLKTHVEGTTPIDYSFYLAKVGVTKAIEKKTGNVFVNGQTPYIGVDQQTKEISIRSDIETNEFFKNLDLKAGDIILEMNNKPYSLVNIYDLISESEIWKENDAIIVKIKRNGVEQIIKGTVKLPYEDIETFKATDPSKDKLKNSWLKG